MRNILIICNMASLEVGTIKEHVDALERGLEGHVTKIDAQWAGFLPLDLFDVVILHYSIVLARGGYISPRLAKSLAGFHGLTICFIQDEYRWIDDTAAAFRDLKVDVVYSLVSPDVVRQVYPHPWCDDIRFEYTLTGFVNEDLNKRDVPPFESRPLDVGYRGRKLSAWYGYHSLQKWQIAERFLDDAKRFDLKVDISTREEDRIYGDDWLQFISQCRAVLGTESGASVCDFTGEIERAVELHLATHPDATYEELRDLYFSEVDGKIVMNVISPRCFEAAALRTLMVMYPGDYGGILKRGRHYVALEPDHSNIEEVVAIIRDPAKAKPIIDCAYEEIACSGRWSVDAFVADVSRVMKEELANRGKADSGRGLPAFATRGRSLVQRVRIKMAMQQPHVRLTVFTAKIVLPRTLKVANFLSTAVIKAETLFLRSAVFILRTFLPGRYRDRVYGMLKDFYWKARTRLRGSKG